MKRNARCRSRPEQNQTVKTITVERWSNPFWAENNWRANEQIPAPKQWSGAGERDSWPIVQIDSCVCVCVCVWERDKMLEWSSMCVCAAVGALITLLRDALLTRNRAGSGQILIKTHVRDLQLHTTLNPLLSLILRGQSPTWRASGCRSTVDDARNTSALMLVWFLPTKLSFSHFIIAF